LVVDWWKGVRLWWRSREVEQRLQRLAIGVNSTVDVAEDAHVIMLDFDTKDVGKVRESVRELQVHWQLADAYLYRTKHGYHAIFWFDHVPFERAKMIINYARYVDPMFKYISRYYDHKTLRVAGKHAQGDVVFDRIVPGRRLPSRQELLRGELKRKEHKALIGGDVKWAR
jgi:hypothetical protein